LYRGTQSIALEAAGFKQPIGYYPAVSLKTMSVSTNDLLSMLNRVRKPDAPAAPSAAPAPAAAVAEAEHSAPGAGGDDLGEPTDIGTILAEIHRDEELMTRILGILYRAKKRSPNGGAVAIMPMERELGIARESATFVLNYMKTKHLIEADDKSRNLITVEGIDFLRERLSK
jgi:hypothetical protein